MVPAVVKGARVALEPVEGARVAVVAVEGARVAPAITRRAPSRCDALIIEEGEFRENQKTTVTPNPSVEPFRFAGAVAGRMKSETATI